MAKRKTSRRRRRKIKLTPFQAVIFALVGACLALGLYVGAGGQVGAAPTWQEIYTAVGLSDPLPAAELPAETDAVHFIDVGQADATLLQSGGEYCLVDAGETDSEQALLGYLEQLGVTRLKLLVMSHPHADHIGSMAAVLEAVEVEQVILPDFDKAPYPTTKLFERVMEAIEASGAQVTTARAGQSYPIGNGTLSVLADGVDTDNYNDLSQVLYFEAGELTVLLSGDGEKPVEQAALEAGAVRRAAVFKAAHHGSDTSNTREFLEAVSPAYVAISCGLGNSYGHPHAEPLARFEALGAQVLRTDTDGSVVIAATEDGLQSYTANASKEAA
ncbi:MAG TPA: MBL fold metallo-hydrolase [Candidatus Fournierella merdigallinarum]|nr:MBL fold metallo-hydrolase [Candidatus Fournierella merdigallinarum]